MAYKSQACTEVCTSRSYNQWFGNSHLRSMNSTINLSFRYAENDYVRALEHITCRSFASVSTF